MRWKASNEQILSNKAAASQLTSLETVNSNGLSLNLKFKKPPDVTGKFKSSN